MAALDGASSRVPLGPIEGPPAGYVSTVEQVEILVGVLEGVEPGAWDRRIVDWLAGWDTSTVLTIASWIARAGEREATS
jgi:hypothetical protein